MNNSPARPAGRTPKESGRRSEGPLPNGRGTEPLFKKEFNSIKYINIIII